MAVDSFNVEFEKLNPSQKLEFIHPLALSQAFRISVGVSPMKAVMAKEHFTYLMKIMDLNITYDDGLQHVYDFRAKHSF